MKRLSFFALKTDLLAWMYQVDQQSELKFVRVGNYNSENFDLTTVTFNTVDSIPNLGKAAADSSAACESFLVLNRETPINLRYLHGSSKVFILVDQLHNPCTIAFSPGGLWGGDILLHGYVGTASETAFSKQMMRRFESAAKKLFTKINAFHVGPEALRLLNAGKRLTISAQSPRDFDLIAPQQHHDKV